MKRVIEFKKRNFWSSKLDVDALNERLNELSKDGWQLISIQPVSTFLGVITAYILVIELDT